MSHWFTVLTFLHYLRLVALQSDPLVVELLNGKIRGRDNGGYYSYESIPYAEPPLGELRFEAPRPYSHQWKHTFDATQPPELCLQWSILVDEANKLMGTEDCLTVSVYKPMNESRKTFPVVAVIHGGAFMFGGAAEVGHEMFLANGNVILAKISYRLGPLGFLSTGDADFPGNFGLKDQRLALTWIKENIARFGGEPDNILLFGQSAGGASVHLQLMQPNIKHLAKAAISISGNALDPWAIQQGYKQRAFELANIVGCKDINRSRELKECLKLKDGKDIVTAVRNFLVIGYVPFAIFGPVVESDDTTDSFLTQHPEDIIKSAKLAEIPWLISYTKEDGGFNAAMFLEKQSNGKELIEELNTRWTELAPDLMFYRQTMNSTEQMDNYSNDLKKGYLGNRSFNLDSYWDVQRMFTDILFKASVAKLMILYKKHSRSPLYAYIYDNPSKIGLAQWLARRTDFNFGTVHCDDFFLMFGTQPDSTLTSDERAISLHFIQMIEGFAQSSDSVLTYSNCKFRNNLEHKQIQMLSISRDGCENVQMDVLP
ncbi:hypothetical protein KR044_011677 [Drosophila immigrans]|nr:hypothetical protein KR044_011677 [Drosophila immigrans]